MDPKTFFFKLPRENKPTNIQLPEVWYPKIRDYWDRSTSTRYYNPIFGVRAVVIHATAGYSSDGAVSVMKDGKASFHWLVPDEDEFEHGNIIWACAPETLAAWHVRNSAFSKDIWNGKNKINHWSLGVELVNSQMNDPFSEWQVKVTADIVKYCWAKYPNLEYVVSHAKLDPTRRTDPGVYFPWEKFKKSVLNENYDDLIVYRDIISKKGELEYVQVQEDICC